MAGAPPPPTPLPIYQMLILTTYKPRPSPPLYKYCVVYSDCVFFKQFNEYDC